MNPAFILWRIILEEEENIRLGKIVLNEINSRFWLWWQRYNLQGIAVSRNLEQWRNEKVDSPYVFRSAAAIKENVAWRLESMIRIMISITAVEYPRARPASIRIAILVKIHELIEGAKIHRPIASRQIFNIHSGSECFRT